MESSWTILCFLVGFFGSSQIVSFALIKENHAAGLSGTAIGFLNGMVTGAGALLQPLVGLLLDMAWKGQTSLGARVYEVSDYRVALSSLAGGMQRGRLRLPAPPCARPTAGSGLNSASPRGCRRCPRHDDAFCTSGGLSSSTRSAEVSRGPPPAAT